MTSASPTRFTPAWQVNVDGFYKDAKYLNDLGQFGNAIILSPIRYHRGYVDGAEISSTYNEGGVSLFGNFAYVQTGAHNINSSQYLFGPDELAYIQTHDVHLDHESHFTASAGAAYTWKNDRVYVDVLYGSGLALGLCQYRSPAPVLSGQSRIRTYLSGQAPGSQRHPIPIRHRQHLRPDLPVRSGSGIGVAAPQYGQRRGFYAGLTFDF